MAWPAVALVHDIDGGEDGSKSVADAALRHVVLVLLEPQSLLDANMVIPHHILAEAVSRLAHLCVVYEV